MTILFVFLEIIGIGMVFCTVLHAKLVRKPMRYIVGSVILILLQYIFQLTGSDFEGAFGIQCFGWVLPFFYVENYGVKKILNFHIAYNGFSIVSVAFAYMWVFIVGVEYTELIQTTFYKILVDITVIIILAVYGYATRKKEKRELELNLGQSLVLFIGLWCLGLIIGFAQMIESDILYSERMGRIVGIMMTTVSILFILLSVWQQISWRRVQEYKLQNKMYETYLSIQEKHIKDVILRDEKIRHFRHDFRAHMTAIDALLKKDKIEELKQYVEQIQDKQQEWESECITGSYAVDAVIGECYQKAQGQNIIWEWEGILYLEDSTLIYDMCVLFSNLLNNAIEACEKLEKVGVIKVKIGKFQGKNYISISNTCRQNLKIEDLSTTSKGDGRYHGLGIRNIQEVVNKRNGTMEYEIGNGWFHIKVIV